MTKRGKTPSLISGSSGNPSLVEARKNRKCKRCNCNINSGDKLFEIPNLGTGFRNKRAFCKCCFKEILEQTQKDLNSLEFTWRKL